jgi:hypothetical protein
MLVCSVCSVYSVFTVYCLLPVACIFTLTPTPLDVLTALSRFDKLTTLSQPKGLSKGSPLKGEGV